MGARVLSCAALQASMCMRVCGAKKERAVQCMGALRWGEYRALPCSHIGSLRRRGWQGGEGI